MHFLYRWISSVPKKFTCCRNRLREESTYLPILRPNYWVAGACRLRRTLASSKYRSHDTRCPWISLLLETTCAAKNVRVCFGSDCFWISLVPDQRYDWQPNPSSTSCLVHGSPRRASQHRPQYHMAGGCFCSLRCHNPYRFGGFCILGKPRQYPSPKLWCNPASRWFREYLRFHLHWNLWKRRGISDTQTLPSTMPAWRELVLVPCCFVPGEEQRKILFWQDMAARYECKMSIMFSVRDRKVGEEW